LWYTSPPRDFIEAEAAQKTAQFWPPARKKSIKMPDDGSNRPQPNFGGFAQKAASRKDERDDGEASTD
jgi:hypothetical protein